MNDNSSSEDEQESFHHHHHKSKLKQQNKDIKPDFTCFTSKIDDNKKLVLKKGDLNTTEDWKLLGIVSNHLYYIRLILIFIIMNDIFNIYHLFFVFLFFLFF